MAINEIPVGEYVVIGGIINATAKTDLSTNLTKLFDLIPNPDPMPEDLEFGVSGSAPEYDKISPLLARHLRTELAAMNFLWNQATEA